MSDITISLIITGIVIVLYVTQIFPLSVTSMFGALAMAFTGVITFEDSISAFGTDALLLVVGAVIMGNALAECGVTQIIGNTILRIPRVGQSEKLFLAIVMSICAILSGFLSNTACVAMFLPLIAGTAAASGGVITKKNTYMGVGYAALVGGSCTLVGSTPQLIANGVLEQTEGCDTMGFFTLAKGGILIVAIVVLYFVTFGYKLEKKLFTFDEVIDEAAIAAANEKADYNKTKAIISSAIFVACIICFVVGIGSVGTVALGGGALCIATRCITEKQAFITMDWRAVTVMGGALGMAKGLNESGAIQMIAEKTLALFGGQDANPFVICFALFVLGSILGNIISHAATSAIMTPLAIAMAIPLGVNPITFVIAMILGSNSTFMTPIATPPVTMTLAGGYQFMDYVKVGGVLNVLVIIIVGLLVPVIYGF